MCLKFTTTLPLLPTHTLRQSPPTQTLSFPPTFHPKAINNMHLTLPFARERGQGAGRERERERGGGEMAHIFLKSQSVYSGQSM